MLWPIGIGPLQSPLVAVEDGDRGGKTQNEAIPVRVVEPLDPPVTVRSGILFASSRSRTAERPFSSIVHRATSGFFEINRCNSSRGGIGFRSSSRPSTPAKEGDFCPHCADRRLRAASRVDLACSDWILILATATEGMAVSRGELLPVLILCAWVRQNSATTRAIVFVKRTCSCEARTSIKALVVLVSTSSRLVS